MTKFLDRFKTQIKVKALTGIFANEKDLDEFQGFLLENAGWNDTLKEALVTSAKARHNLKTKVLLYWRRISVTYNLDEDKVYEMDSKTGEITLSKNQLSNKGEKK